MINNLSEYQRYSHFEYIKVSGGDAVSKEPWRSAASYLYAYFGNTVFDKLSFLKQRPAYKNLKTYLRLLENDFNTYHTCSAGRLFDAVSSLVGLTDIAGYHAEAPMRLESVIDDTIDGSYPYEIRDVISFKQTFEGILSDLDKRTDPARISAKFHNTLIRLAIEMSEKMRAETGIDAVVLSGGTFQNKYLLTHIESKLKNKGFRVYTPTLIPSNDGGIALGQLIIAANRIKN
jgi:hydrogenase maturation protein HypF